MKKIVLTVLTAAMLLSLAACGAKQAPETTATEVPVAQEVTATEAPAAQEIHLDFTLVNNTGMDLTSLAISENGKSDWSENLLTDGGIIADGESHQVTFSANFMVPTFDILVADANGTPLTFAGMDASIASATLEMVDGQPTVSVEAAQEQPAQEQEEAPEEAPAEE